MSTCMKFLKLIKERIYPKLGQIISVGFSRKYLLYTNVTISITLSGLGDVIEQNLEMWASDEEKSWDNIRTRNMSIYGMATGTFCHFWYNFLDSVLPGYGMRTVVKKIFVDQMICSPICVTSLFVTSGLLERKSRTEVLAEFKQKALILYKAEWTVWPVAQFINFYLLPNRYRVLYDNTISLGYDIYTSHVKHDDTIGIS